MTKASTEVHWEQRLNTETPKGTAAGDHTATWEVCDRELGVGLIHPEQSSRVARPAPAFLNIKGRTISLKSLHSIWL